MGVSTASPWPPIRSSTHFSTRELSPKPGQMNAPSASLRNQLTKNSLGSWVPGLSPMSSQCWK